jgi:hypothetical protein
MEKHLGPVHLNYVFAGKVSDVKACIARRFQGYKLEFQANIVRIAEFEAKLKCLEVGELYYLDTPFYFPIQA